MINGNCPNEDKKVEEDTGMQVDPKDILPDDGDTEGFQSFYEAMEAAKKGDKRPWLELCAQRGKKLKQSTG